MIRKLLISLLALVMCFTACFALASCSDDPVAGPQGDKGDKGDKGDQGPAGEPGTPGVGIASVAINDDGKLVITYTDNTTSTIDFPAVSGKDGEDGVGITSVELNDEGKLVINFTKGEPTVIELPVAENADGEAEVTVKSIKSENGKLVITYTDGTTNEIVINATCAHENGREEVVLVKHTIDANGTYLYVCNDCGHSEIAYKTVHEFETGKVTEATCTTPEKTSDVCKICGFEENAVEVGEALGHAWVNDKVVVEEGNTICEDGGQKVDYCTRCYIVNSYVTGPTGHDVAEWTKRDATADVEGSIAGLCETCGKNITVELPKLDKVNYAYAEEIEINSCATRKGNATYTIYVNAKGELAATETEGYTALVTEVALTPSAHMLNGEYMTKKEYDCELEGITEYVDHKATCTEPGLGVYVCDTCGEDVPVTTTKEHTYDPEKVTEVTKPSCETTGKGTAKCTVCNNDIEVVIDALGHDWSYKLREEDGKKYLDLTCKRCGKPETIEAVNYTETAPTCLEKGKIEVVVEGEDEPLVFELDKVPHELNGNKMTKTEYPYNLDGITEFVDHKAACKNNEKGLGQYVCDNCGKEVPVTTYMEHTWTDEGATVTKPATCTEAGSKSGHCSVCDEDVTQVIPALGHDWEYELDERTVGEEKVLYLVLTCKRPVGEGDTATTCGYTEEYEVVDEPTIVDPRCDREGSITVSVVIDEQTVIKTFPIQKVWHKLGDTFMDPEGTYLSTTEGIVEFIDHKATCQTPGLGQYDCTVCGKAQPVTTIGDHVGETTTVDATCTTAGSVTTKCTVCGKTDTKIIDALGHDVSCVATVIPTWTTNGTFVMSCSRCDMQVIFENALPTLDSEYYEVVVDIEPSCKNEGKGTYTLKNVVPGVDVVFTVVYDFTDHVEFDYEEDHIYTWLADVEELVDVDETVEKTYFFLGYVCEACGKMIVLEKTEVEREYEIAEDAENVIDEMPEEMIAIYAELGLEVVGVYTWEVEVTEGEGEEAVTTVYAYMVGEFKLTATGEVFYMVDVYEVEDDTNTILA